MKTCLFRIFVSAVVVMTTHGAWALGPAAVSPGNDQGIAMVGDVCPTFSWSSSERALGYELAVFEAPLGESLAYEVREKLYPPVMRHRIDSPALSWTPDLERALDPGVMYVWYVRALDVYGNGTWGPGSMFLVDETAPAAHVREIVERRIAEYWDDQEIQSPVIKKIAETVKEEILEQGGGVFPSQENVSQGASSFLDLAGTEDTYYTMYGDGAGYTILNEPGIDPGANRFNTFIGKNAGHDNNGGEYNTFIGGGAGSQNVTGNRNTLVGYKAGSYNNAGYNTMVGSWAGFQNTGAGNVFLGYLAGYNASGSGMLYIDNSSTDYPLIYGEFGNDLVPCNI